jgi:hypothetical protein
MALQGAPYIYDISRLRVKPARRGGVQYGLLNTIKKGMHYTLSHPTDENHLKNCVLENVLMFWGTGADCSGKKAKGTR